MTLVRTYDENMADIAASEEQRHAAEVRYLAAMSTDAQRAVYLNGEGGVRQKRGDAAYERLRRDVWALMKGQAKPVEPMQEGLL